jgi:S-adenosylhomocysteine hydrolase
MIDSKVADLSLADWGRKDMDLSEIEMPGLKSGIYLIVFKNRKTTINKKVTIY